MIPIPTSRVFRSRRGALMWSFWVIVAAVMTAGFGDAPATDNTTAAHPTDALGVPVDDQDVKALVQAMNTMNAS